MGSTILAKDGLKSWDIWLGFVNKQKFWSFWVIVGFELWVMGFEFKLWVLKTMLRKLSDGETKRALSFWKSETQL